MSGEEIRIIYKFYITILAGLAISAIQFEQAKDIGVQ